MPTAIGENLAKKKLAANELVLCMGVNQLRTPNIAMIAAACGFDAVYIDLEHNPTSLETAAAVCVAALGMGITPIARVTSHDPHDATRRAAPIAASASLSVAADLGDVDPAPSHRDRAEPRRDPFRVVARRRCG